MQARHRPKPPSSHRCRARRPRGRRCVEIISRTDSLCRVFVSIGPLLPMEIPGRLYLGACCRIAVLICTYCDHGQRYCAGECACKARAHCVREAGRRYQGSLKGRHAHAARQRRYRARKAKVTHQSSPPPVVPALLPVNPSSCVKTASPLPWHCHFCHRPLVQLVRTGFLRRRVRRPPRTDRRKPHHGPAP